MLETLTDWILKLADPLLNWLLLLPSDVALFIVGVGTGAILTYARLFTTNQDLLGRCDQDKKRLKQLTREARRGKDKEAVRRYQASKNMIGLKQMKAEGMPLLAAIVPILVLGTWAFCRLEFHPPQAGETVAARAYFPVSAAGEMVYIVPQEHVAAEGGWAQEIVAVTDPAEGPPHAMATWRLKAEARPEPYDLEIRYKDRTYSKQLLVGQRTYAPAAEFYTGGDLLSADVEMKQIKLFGIVPGIPAILFPPWVVAYLLIAVPSVSLIKRVAKIY